MTNESYTQEKTGICTRKKKGGGGMRFSDYVGGNKVFVEYSVVRITWGQERLLESD